MDSGRLGRVQDEDGLNERGGASGGNINAA
jgi:hypothetical protein